MFQIKQMFMRIGVKLKLVTCRVKLPAPSRLLMLLLAGYGITAQALPTGGKVVEGNVALQNPSSTTLNVVQGTQRGIINWGSFSVASDERVSFQQPGSTAVTLNRVVGGDLSSIFGRIDANGQIFLINPSGITFAPGASVNVSGLVASTLDISNNNFRAGSYKFVGTGFLPEIDEGAFVVDYVSPGGTALPETDREVHVVEKILASMPEITGTSRRTGAELGLFATEQNTGDIVARLLPQSRRSRTIFEVIDDVRTQAETAVPRLRIDFVQILSDVINDLAGAAKPVEVKLYGSDIAALEKYAESVTPDMEKIDGIADFYNGISEPSAEMSMSIDAAEAARIGMTPDLAGRLLARDSIPDADADSWGSVLIANSGKTATERVLIPLISGELYALMCQFRNADSLPQHAKLGMVALERVE